MSGIFATAGSKVYIGQVMTAQSADFTSSDFQGQSWTEIGWLETIGQFGGAATASRLSKAWTTRLATVSL